MPTQIQMRRGTQAEWDAANPVLADGEHGLVTDTGEERVGDGVTAFADLPPILSGTFETKIFFNLKTDGGALGQDPVTDTAAWIAALKQTKPIFIDDEFHVDTGFRKSVDAPDVDEFVIVGAGRDRANIKWVGTGDGPMLWLSENNARSRIYIADVWFSSNATRGHTSTTYDTFTTTTTGDAGTDSTATCLRLDRATFGTVLDRVHVSDFEKGVLVGDASFGVDIRTSWIHWCNIGVDFDTPTTSQISDGSIIERCAIGLRLRAAQQIDVANSVIEANYAGCDVFDYQWNDIIAFHKVYFEASPDVYWHEGDSTGDFQTEHVTFTECIGLDCYFGNFIKDVRLERNRLNGLENNYTAQDGPRRIVCKDNRKADGTTFGPADVTGNDAEEVIFEAEYGHFRHATGRFYSTPPGSGTTNQVVNELVYFVPFVLGQSLTLDRMAIEVTTAGEANSVVRLGVYRDKDGLPDSLIVDAGTVAADTTGTKTITTIGQYVEAGMVWVAVVAQGASTTPPTLRGTDAPNEYVASASSQSVEGNAVAYRMDAVSGALPSTTTIASGARAFGPRAGVYFT